MHRRDHAPRAGPLDHWFVFVRRSESAEAGFSEPDALGPEVVEIGLRQTRLKDYRARVNPHSPRTPMLKTLQGGDRERLHPNRIFGATGYMDLGGSNCRCHPAVDVAFEEADGLLSRRVVAERDVNMRIDQTRNCNRACGIYHDVTCLNACG